MKGKPIIFIAGDHWHSIHRIEWKTKLEIEHGFDRDFYYMDHELEWERAKKHYVDTYNRDLSGLNLIAVSAAVNEPTRGLRIVDVEDRVSKSDREKELELLTTEAL